VRQLPRRIDAGGETLRVGVSIGVAVVPLDATTPADAMHCADVALYQAKRAGKDGYARFTAALGDARRERLSLERELRDALAKGRVELAYQPIFDATGALDSFEALARWHHPQRGWVSPAEFIPMAEESGLIVELGLATLTCLGRDLMGWRMRGLHPVPVALNLSSRQFRRESQRTLFLEHLRALDLGPELVEFELTESSVFEDLDSPTSILPRLQALGYRLALDDFGTGYSSLAYLRRLKCCKLKIDRTFVDGVARSEDAAMLIESIVRVAHAMDMKVVGEGVERASDQVRLLRLGCDLFQGYGLARPLPFNSAAKLLDSFARGDPQMSLVGRATQPRPLFEE
jgi:diguanylate cyclase